MTRAIILLRAPARPATGTYEIASGALPDHRETMVRPDGGPRTRGSSTRGQARFSARRTHQGLRATRLEPRPAWSLWASPCTVYTDTTRNGRPAAASAMQITSWRALSRETGRSWDFHVPRAPDRIDDSSASQIAASGLWNLAE